MVCRCGRGRYAPGVPIESGLGSAAQSTLASPLPQEGGQHSVLALSFSSGQALVPGVVFMPLSRSVPSIAITAEAPQLYSRSPGCSAVPLGH